MRVANEFRIFTNVHSPIVDPQVLFFEADSDDVCETSYADKSGKYQSQRGVTLPKL
jgi:deoxycytidine triphosphate deaminase